MNSSSRPLRRVCRHCLSLRKDTTRFASTEVVRQPLRGALPPSYPPPLPKPARLDPNTVTSPRYERRLLRSRVFPVGSRRRRAALQKSANIPFEQLPYQCFQEARTVLQLDREDKVRDIEVQRARIQRLVEQDVSVSGGTLQKENRLTSMRRHLEHLKVLADINDPLVKKRFEDGKGDMSRPIYRHLAKTKWEKMKKLIIQQRVEQMNLAPDILPRINITADVSLYYQGRQGEDKIILPQRNRRHESIVQPGQFVASKVSRNPPRLHVQLFDKGERFITIAVVDPDVPNVEKDTFDHRCHFLAVNIPVTPTTPSIRLDTLSQKDQVILSWTPPYAIKGSPYHRLAVIVLQQPDGQKIDMNKILSNYRHHSRSTGARPPPPMLADVVTEEADAEEVQLESTEPELQNRALPASESPDVLGNEAAVTSQEPFATSTPSPEIYSEPTTSEVTDTLKQEPITETLNQDATKTSTDTSAPDSSSPPSRTHTSTTPIPVEATEPSTEESTETISEPTTSEVAETLNQEPIPETLNKESTTSSTVPPPIPKSSTTPSSPSKISTAVAKVVDKIPRDNFKLRAFVDRHHLHTIGAHLFRTEWDIWMDKTMRGAGYEGAGTELRRKPSEKLPYKKKDGARYR